MGERHETGLERGKAAQYLIAPYLFPYKTRVESFARLYLALPDLRVVEEKVGFCGEKSENGGEKSRFLHTSELNKS